MSLLRTVWPVLLGLAAAAPALHAQKIILAEKVEVLETRVRADSNDPAAHYNVAMGYLSKKRYDEAERALRSALELDPLFADAWLALSLVQNWNEDHWKRLRKEGGDSLVERAMKERSGYERRAFVLDPLVDVKILGATYRISGTSHAIKGFEAVIEGRYDQAFDHLSRAHDYYRGEEYRSTREYLRFLRSLAAARIGRYDDAVADLTMLLDSTRLERKDSIDYLPFKGNEFRYMIAAIRHREGRLAEAAALYEEVATEDLGNFMAHARLAAIHEAQGRWPQAIVERERALAVEPENAGLVLDLGVTQGKAGRFDDAAGTLRRAAELSPRDARPWYWLGLVEMRRDEGGAARDAFTRFLALAPARYEPQINAARQRLEELK